MPVFERDDFGIAPSWDGDDVWVDHFHVAEGKRRQKLGSAILETLKRVYYYEGADRLYIKMGGGEAAESFLKANDFDLVERRPYDDVDETPGEYGVTAVYEYDR